MLQVSIPQGCENEQWPAVTDCVCVWGGQGVNQVFTPVTKVYRCVAEVRWRLSSCGVMTGPSWHHLLLQVSSKLTHITNTAAKMRGLPTPSLTKLNCRSIRRIAVTIGHQSHPLNCHFTILPSSRRYRPLKCRRAHFGKSILHSRLQQPWIRCLTEGNMTQVVWSSVLHVVVVVRRCSSYSNTVFFLSVCDSGCDVLSPMCSDVEENPPPGQV